MTAIQHAPNLNSMSEPAIDWTEQLSQHQRWLMNVLRSRINNPHVVEDIFQEVSLAVLRQESRPTDPDKVAPWLYRLAVRHVINFHRKTGRRKRLQERVQHEALVTEQHEPNALHWLLQDEQKKLVTEALQQLRPQDREILSLKYAENWTYQQLSDHLGATTGTIEYRLIRARKRLRKLLCDM